MAAILVTGATGFVGAHLVPRLVDAGHHVLGLARASSDTAHLDGWWRGSCAQRDVDLGAGHFEWLRGDVTDAPSMAAAAEALRAAADRRGEPAELVHGAGLISYATGAGPALERVNVEGTRHAVGAAALAGVRRLLVVSSVVAVGVAPSVDAPLDEDAPFERVRALTGKPYVSEYMRTKRAAEELAFAEGAAAGLDVVAVNPGSIYGQAPVPSNSSQIFKRVERGLLGRIASPGSLSVVGVEDVAAGIQLALERGAPGRRYLLTDENLAMAALLKRIQRTVGVERPLLTPGPATWRALVRGACLVDRFRPLHVVTPTALELLGCSFSFDSTRARRELGWQPQPFDTVLRRTAEWLHSIGWLTGPLPRP